LLDRGIEEMNRSQRVLASASVAGLALLFLLALVISYQFQTAGYYSDQAERSRGILIAVQNLNRGLMKAESGQRGFLLTSKASYLDSYFKGVTASQSALADIARQLKDDNAEQEQQATLRDLVQAKLHELSETVELETAHRHSEAIAIVQSDRGQDLMDRIQQINGILLDNERVRLGAHSTAIQAGRLLTGRLFRAGLIGMAVLVMATAFLIWRSLAAQRIAIQALRHNEAKLAEKEHLLRTITDNLPVLISYIDSNEVVRFSNLTYKTWLNRDPKQALGRPLVDVMGPEMYASRREHIRNVLAGRLTEFQAVLDLTDGPRHHQVTYLPDTTADGRVSGFFALTMDITALKRIEAQLEQLARHDTLTGLPNRRHFEERLSEFLLQREQGAFALMFLDIDHFKAINDAYGHATGDAALKHFSECLKACVRATDTIARLAGDEFVVLLPRLHKRADAETVARKIIKNARLGFTVNGRTLNMTASIGISYAREAAVTSDALFASADEALYAAKNGDRDTFKVMECNGIDLAQRPSRRRSDVRQRNKVGASSRDS
jgi:diguanylate cyclase (GGDEF)-like protein/PAS domain S-box-containing protein